MEEKPDKRKLADQFEAALESAAARVIQNRKEWDELVASASPEQSALLKELTIFAELWEYFQRQQLHLPQDIVEDLSGIEKLPIDQRTVEYREINQRLLARVPNADSGNKSRM